MNVEQHVKDLTQQIRDLGTRIRWLRAHQKDLESLPEATWCGSLLDFDRLEHKDVIRVVRALGGKWSKDANIHADPQKPSIDYQRKDPLDGINVRCWGGAPPPTCRLVEVEEEIPERVLPACKVKKLKLICTGAEPVAVALSRANSPLPQS